jgi:hypothetical protein
MEEREMNLNMKNAAVILFGGIVFAGLGWVVSFAFHPGLLPDIEDVVGLQGAGLIFGGIAGMGLTVVAIVARAAREPGAESARNFSRINGTGSTLIGRTDRRDDGSYVATEWFTILWIPIFPVCRYRLIESPGGSFVCRQYQVLEKLPPRGADAIRVYLSTAAVLLTIAGLAYLVFR